MSQLLYAVLNPIVKALLRSPLHGVMSGNTTLLEFEGRKSGKAYATPVSYREADGALHCFTARAGVWWRNLDGADSIGVVLRGDRRRGRPSVDADGSEAVRDALREMLIAVPRDAAFAGVKLDAEGRPDDADLARAAGELVYIRIELID